MKRTPSQRASGHDTPGSKTGRSTDLAIPTLLRDAEVELQPVPVIPRSEAVIQHRLHGRAVLRIPSAELLPRGRESLRPRVTHQPMASTRIQGTNQPGHPPSQPRGRKRNELPPVFCGGSLTKTPTGFHDDSMPTAGKRGPCAKGLGEPPPPNTRYLESDNTDGRTNAPHEPQRGTSHQKDRPSRFRQHHAQRRPSHQAQRDHASGRAEILLRRLISGHEAVRRSASGNGELGHTSTWLLPKDG